MASTCSRDFARPAASAECIACSTFLSGVNFSVVFVMASHVEAQSSDWQLEPLPGELESKGRLVPPQWSASRTRRALPQLRLR
mmetsp:Transcript_13947/g.37446  ORF Transcript_13947/g.37446 Transcript_13947/m.37446 type:complete len:83 (+) Transcript_13947:244-492(+)